MSRIRPRTVIGFLLAFAAMAVCLLAGASAAILLNRQPVARPNSEATPTLAVTRPPAANATSSVKNTAAPSCHSDDPGKDLIQGPPKDLQDYANFVRAVASRYKGRIRAYEIWNEPNLAREWCGKPPSGKEYVQLLKLAYETIKAADPTAWIISAGLSPTTRNDNVA